MPHLFVLMLTCFSLGLFGCSPKVSTSKYATQFPHAQEDWFEWRSLDQNKDLAQVRDEDQAMDAQHKPANYGAPYQHREGTALWQSYCMSCHGARGNSNPQNWQPAPRKLGGMGLKMGFFFGGDKMRAGIFHKIKTGKSLKKRQEAAMPAFGTTLSNEQIWALVLFLENI